MAKFDIEKLITKHTDGENVDYTKVNDELDSQNKNIVAKEVAKETKKFDKDIIIDEFLKENEFKSMDEFNAFKKNGATADTEAVRRLETELIAANDKLKTIPTLQSELNTFKNQSLLRGKGNLTQDELEFIEYKINKLEGESFEEKYTKYVEANPDVFTEVQPPKNIITTGTKIGTKAKTGETFGWEDMVDDRYGE